MRKKYFRYLDLPFKVEKPNFEDVDFPKIYGDGAGYIVMKKHLPIHERVINFVHGIEGLIVFYIIYLMHTYYFYIFLDRIRIVAEFVDSVLQRLIFEHLPVSLHRTS